MVEHFCKEHHTLWFRKGKMKGYAHPILDDNGEQSYGEDGKPLWCNEPEGKPQESKPKEAEMSKEEWAEKNKLERRSIERQVSAKIAFEHYASDADIEGDIDLILLKAERIYQWISKGIIEPSPKTPDKPKEAISKKQSTGPETTPSELSGKIKPAKEQTGSDVSETATSHLDLDWVKEQIGILQGKGLKAWTNASILSYLKTVCKIEAKTPSEAIKQLDEKDSKDFEQRIKDAIEVS